MSDSPNTFFSPYPGTLSQSGTEDDSFRAALVSHANASVERNQDSQFAAGRTQLVHRDVVGGTKDAQIETLKAHHASDRERDRQFAELKAELASMRADGLRAQLDGIRAETTKGALADILTAVKGLAK